MHHHLDQQPTDSISQTSAPAPTPTPTPTLKRRRLPPLTIEEYENDFSRFAGDLQLVERVFYGGLSSNKLRATLWPYILGLVKHRGRFIKRSPSLPASNGNSHSTSCSSLSSAASTSSSSPSPSPSPPPPPLAEAPPLVTSTTCEHRKAAASNGSDRGQHAGDQGDGNYSNFVYIEHEKNLIRWRELESLYYAYETQWKSIMPDQELRFSVFRERKALIERDVIRSDRTHPFYAENSTNLHNLITILMTYMMYDFDIGYLQGVSDLAAPILYVYQGDLVKSFWVFVEVMKLFRRNFEFSQKTIHFQLNSLFRLIKLTDPKLARHLRENYCSNCFFVFRCIVCQFKRELMKSNNCDSLDDDDYTKVLNLWDTIWCVQRRHELQAKTKCVHIRTTANSNHRRPDVRSHQSTASGISSSSSGSNSSCNNNNNNNLATDRNSRQHSAATAPRVNNVSPRYNQADVPRFELTETEKFVLSLCLSLIKRERNQILQNRLDASEIHQHFINPHLTRDFDAFVDHAYEIYQYLNTDCDLKLLVKGANELNGGAASDLSPICDIVANSDEPGCEPEAADTYDLLKDYFIISPTSYNISMTSLNNTKMER